MPTLEYFEESPEFPSDTPIVDIPILSHKDLVSNSEKASEDLFDASIEYGMFLLDLRGSETGEKLLKDARAMFELSKATYKPPGTLKTENGKFDAVEVYTLNQDDALGTCPTPHPNPSPFEAHQKDLEGFFHNAHQVLCDIFSHLDKHLALAPGTLASLCPMDKPSATALRLLLTRPVTDPVAESQRIAFGGHTDVGLITMLFNVVGGLQILPAGIENIAANWPFVKPQPGCAIFQIADTLVERTGGLLRSALHRIITPPGKQALVTRRSLAYLIRIEDNGSMRRLKSDGGVIPQLAEDEEDEDESRTPAEWAEWRVRRVMNGELAPQTNGGRRVGAKAKPAA
ncbi:Oxidoreductase vrtI [Lachnellula arida]|uniref:Oxidoreductase vrtI n=1 Tax=Lachnellula arida TaxID=1316785 RepID=A0A8T9B889_9HELO|nr:Oxidoreductase vrtI [Lachnellula arida]